MADQDPEFVRRAFSDIAGRYVITNHVLSLGTDILWRNKVARMARDLKPGLVLDLATGSGDLAEAVGRQCTEAQVICADFCVPMLAEARKRGLEFLVAADGTNLPFEDGAFDLVTVGFGLRNMESWSAGLREMSRVLKPGGNLLILDFSLPRWQPAKSLYRFYLHRVLPRVSGWMTGHYSAYAYLSGSIERFPSGDAMCDLMRSNGFAEARSVALSFGIASVYRGMKSTV